MTRLAFSTLGCPGASLDHVLELAKGNNISAIGIGDYPIAGLLQVLQDSDY